MFKSGKETKALLLLGCYKIGFALLCVGLLFASADQGWFNESQFERVFQKWPLEGEANLASYLAAWDGAHYLELAKLGYRPGDSSCAFYPLWPHLVRWVAPLTGGNLVVAGLLLANLFSFVGALLFYRLAKLKVGECNARWALAFLLAFPGALFFQFIYSEALFFLILMAFFLGLETKHYKAVAVAGLLLPLVRPVGIFALAPLAWALFQRREPFQRWLCLLGPVLGYGLYLGWMAAMTGNAMEGFDAQKNWSVNSAWNVFKPLKFIEAFLNPTSWHGYRASMLDRCLFMVFASSLIVVWRLGGVWFVAALAFGLLPAVLSSFTSYTRYMMMAYPMFVAMALLTSETPKVRWAVLGVLGVLQVVLLGRYLNWYWAG